MKKVKLCGFKDPETAFFAAKCGADFIGIMQYPASKRYVPLSLAKEIAAAAKKGGAEPVLVFVNATTDEVIASCRETEVTTVQCYGASPLLPSLYRLFSVNSTPIHGLRKGDYLVFDHAIGGQGIPLNREIFKPETEHPWFLAGGLNSTNINEALDLFNPDGVDVSTGIEKEGNKDPDLIQEFIKKVRQYGA